MSAPTVELMKIEFVAQKSGKKDKQKPIYLAKITLSREKPILSRFVVDYLNNNTLRLMNRQAPRNLLQYFIARVRRNTVPVRPYLKSTLKKLQVLERHGIVVRLTPSLLHHLNHREYMPEDLDLGYAWYPADLVSVVEDPNAEDFDKYEKKNLKDNFEERLSFTLVMFDRASEIYVPQRDSALNVPNSVLEYLDTQAQLLEDGLLEASMSVKSYMTEFVRERLHKNFDSYLKRVNAIIRNLSDMGYVYGVPAENNTAVGYSWKPPFARPVDKEYPGLIKADVLSTVSLSQNMLAKLEPYEFPLD